MNEPTENQFQPSKQIVFKDGTVEIPTAPLCTIEQIHEAQRIIEEKYPELASILPENHYWRQSKELHEIQTQDNSLDVLEELGFDPNDPNARLAMFIGEVHDLGRIIDGYRNDHDKILPEGYEGLEHHGQFSVRVLENWQALEGFSPEAQEIIKFVVEHHAEKDRVELPENANDKQKFEYVFNCLFRDLDKLAIFEGKAERNMYDESERTRQTKVMKGVVGEQNYLGENGTITDKAMENFQNEKLNGVKEFFTYETFCLNTMSFIYDINLVSVLKKVVDSGIINKSLAYFKKQLSDKQYQAIDSKIHSYLDQRGLKLPEDNSEAS